MPPLYGHYGGLQSQIETNQQAILAEQGSIAAAEERCADAMARGDLGQAAQERSRIASAQQRIQDYNVTINFNRQSLRAAGLGDT